MIPLSAPEFYLGLEQRFPKRDGMFFLPAQVVEYDKKRMQVEGAEAAFVLCDGRSLRHSVAAGAFTRETPNFSGKFILNLSNNLAAGKNMNSRWNFLPCWKKISCAMTAAAAYRSRFTATCQVTGKSCAICKKMTRYYNVKLLIAGTYRTPTKAADLEKLRERTLLREFEHYKQAPRRLKVFRLEAVRAGFKKCWQERDYATIIAVAEKIPHTALEEDPKTADVVRPGPNTHHQPVRKTTDEHRCTQMHKKQKKKYPCLSVSIGNRTLIGLMRLINPDFTVKRTHLTNRPAVYDMILPDLDNQ